MVSLILSFFYSSLNGSDHPSKNRTVEISRVSPVIVPPPLSLHLANAHDLSAPPTSSYPARSPSPNRCPSRPPTISAQITPPLSPPPPIPHRQVIIASISLPRPNPNLRRHSLLSPPRRASLIYIAVAPPPIWRCSTSAQDRRGVAGSRPSPPAQSCTGGGSDDSSDGEEGSAVGSWQPHLIPEFTVTLSWKLVDLAELQSLAC